MTPKERAAMQQALEALKDYHKYDEDKISVAMSILQEALEQPVSQEPVGIVEASEEWGIAGVLTAGLPIGTKLYTAPQPVSQEPFGWYSDKGGFNECGEGQPLYTSPQPAKQEVELTDDEIDRIVAESTGLLYLDFARAVIAAYKEKQK